MTYCLTVSYSTVEMKTQMLTWRLKKIVANIGNGNGNRQKNIIKICKKVLDKNSKIWYNSPVMKENNSESDLGLYYKACVEAGYEIEWVYNVARERMSKIRNYQSYKYQA